MKNKFYITTAIDYVNAEPHIGHAFEKTLADAIARWKRQKGEEVFFLTGVDENAQKNVQAAEKARIPVKKFVDKNTALFKELCDRLNISYDDFIRTSAKEHANVVQKLLKKIIDKKDIYTGVYSGLYCVGCETYYSEGELINGKCPEHKTAPELRKEDAYFFKLSKYKKELLNFIPKYIFPESKTREIINRINEEGLNDICISRKGAKWGVDFPNDKNYKVWVWIDALINYISGLKTKKDKFWPAQLHVVGKGINWFHSVIWPAILFSAEEERPEKLLVHGYLNLEGQKISKSLGNTINPIKLIDKYGTDVVRYALLKCTVFDDSDFSEEIVKERNNELANTLGNLVSRVEGLFEKSLGTEIEEDGDKELDKLLDELIKNSDKYVGKHFDNFEPNKALNSIFTLASVCNQYIQEKRVWAKSDEKYLLKLKKAVLKIAELLIPFLPDTAKEIQKRFSAKKIKKSEILFRRIDDKNI